MKKGKKQSIILAVVAAVIISAVIWQGYSAEQTKQRGFAFGNELSRIQEDVKMLQTSFNSKITQWDEGDLGTPELLEYADSHFKRMEGVIEEYGTLDPPAQFSASVELFRLSTDSQLQSDRHYIEWVKTGTESHKIRSDSRLQESFDLEMLALGEFNRAKLGYKEYDGEPAKFEAPDAHMAGKIDKIWESMKERCHAEHTIRADVEMCVQEAERWRAEHMP